MAPERRVARPRPTGDAAPAAVLVREVGEFPVLISALVVLPVAVVAARPEAVLATPEGEKRPFRVAHEVPAPGSHWVVVRAELKRLVESDGGARISPTER